MVVLALGTAATVAAMVVTDRTHTAYARYLDDAEVADLVLNPGLLTADVDEVVRGLPGVRSARVEHYLLATVDDGAPRPGTALQAELLRQVRSSADGRYVASDRPVVAAGRLPTGTAEAFLSAQAAEALDVGVGDELPVAADEIALGQETAEALDLEVGSTAQLAGLFGERRVTVTGLVAMPAYGPVLSDRAGLGAGMYATAAIVADRDEVDDGAAPVGEDPSLVIIQVADGRDGAARLLDELAAEVGDWDVFSGRPFTYAAPVRPPEVVNVEGMRQGPLLLAAVLAVTVVVGLTSALTLSVRARRYDLAVLRVLGPTGAQVRRSVRWQALTTVGLGLVAGLVLGVVIGGRSWRLFADDLGVAPVTVVPARSLAAIAGGALVVAAVVAARPGAISTRRAPAEVLRDAGG